MSYLFSFQILAFVRLLKIRMASNTKPVAKGGLFGTSERPSYSKETQELLKIMMEESRLTNFQRRKLKESMSDGKSLPARVAPTSSDRKQKQSPPRKSSSRGLSVSSNMRTIDMIEESGAYERDQYIPKPIRSLEKEKERLSNLMAFGEEIEVPKKPKKSPKIQPEKDRFDELQEEISERAKFLDEMIKLGQGDKYRSIISTEISQLIREMEVIDRKRTAELERVLDQQED